MPVQFGSLNFPFEMAAQAQQMKNQNIQNLWKSFQDIGTGAGNVAGAYGKYKALGALQQALQAQRGGAPVDTAAMLPSLVALNPEYGTKAIGDYFNPETQANIAYKKSETAKNQQELAGLLPSQAATLAEQERAHREAEDLRRIMLQQQATLAAGQQAERSRSAMQDEQMRADKLKQDITAHNYMATHWAPWQTKADRDIAAIKGPMDYGYTGPPQIQRKIIKGKLYINTTGDPNGWVHQ